MGLRVLFVALTGKNSVVYRQMWPRPVSIPAYTFANQDAALLLQLAVWCPDGIFWIATHRQQIPRAPRRFRDTLNVEEPGVTVPSMAPALTARTMGTSAPPEM